MSDDNSDSAPSNATRGGVAGAEEEARQGGGSPELSGSSSSDTNRKRGTAPGGVSKTRSSSRGPQEPSLDDTDTHSSGNDSGERESQSRLGREASRGRQSTCSSQFSSSHNGKDSAMILETTESNKSSNSHSPSPPSSSMAYSLLSSSEQDHPSTSGCSSEQSARRQTQKELMKALKELKIRVPADKRSKGRSSTLTSLQYALNCVKQVRANQEYYHQWSVEESHGCSLDLSTFTIEELDNITSDDSAVANEEPTPLHKPMTFQQICKDVHMVKTSGQQVFIDSRNRPPPRKHANTGVLKPCPQPERKEPAPYSYQQINCLDSIIRYLESCNVPNTVKRKCGSSSCTTSSTSDDDKQKDAPGNPNVTLDTGAGQKGAPQGPSHALSPLALHSKAESVVSVTSQCSFSSTIVHVGDKKPPESDIVMEDTTPTPTPAPPTPVAPPAVVAPPTPAPPSPAAPEREGRRAGRLGLTKEVLLAHTQQEEQAFLGRFSDLNQLRLFDPGSALHSAQRRHTATPFAKGVRSSRDYPAVGSSGRRRGRGGKRLKHQEGLAVRRGGGVSGSLGVLEATAEGRVPTAYPPPHHLPLGPQTSSSSWPTSVGSQASLPSIPYPPGVLPLYPLYPPLAPPLSHVGPDAHQTGFSNLQSAPRYPLQTPQLASPLVPPMMAFVLPNYMFPHLNPAAMSPLNPQLNPAAISQLNPVTMSQLNPVAMAQLNPAAMSQLNPGAISQLHPQLNPVALSQLNPAALSQLNPAALSQLNPAALSQLNPAALSQLNPAALSQLNPAALSQLNPVALSQLNPPMPTVPQQFYSPNPTFPFLSPAPVPPHRLVPTTTTTPTPRAQSRSSTPQSSSQPPPEREGVDSPLFQSRCSSPLNLLQLEESPSNRLEVASALAAAQQTPPPVGVPSQDWTGKQGGGAGGQASANRSSAAGDSKENENGEANDSSNQDAMSTSSDLLDLLLQEDSRSGTGSAASGSGSSGSRSGSSGTGSNGCSTSGSGTRSSSNTSKYFGSIDSSENEHSRKQAAGGAGEEQFMKYVLQDPIWLLMANTDEKTMMTYQLPVRDRDQVLRQDRDALRAMQKHQPRFSDQQKRELSKVHPWIRSGQLPRAIDISACVGCRSPPAEPEATPFDVEIHAMELSAVLVTSEETSQRKTPDSSTLFALPETAMEEEEEEEEEEGEWGCCCCDPLK
ncbi:hypothetical protein AAFF_G00149300 [Aldrovandia affinis]|uniref:Uncharacterized protein n=1 Tax=Aldrovandia affinis TaxID=143900 RepID=A0AAD7RPJ5_9TELE|nr:hypothetical protein AAFF_G00149300 [Aldrovandia affinis]